MRGQGIEVSGLAIVVERGMKLVSRMVRKAKQRSGRDRVLHLPKDFQV